MGFEPDNRSHLTKLNSAVCWSIEQLRPHRERLFKHKAQYVGSDYGANSAPASVPINVIELGVNTLQRFIASRAPQVMVGSRYREMLPQAANMELALNQEADRINLGDTFNTWAIEALFCMGVVEVGIAASDTPPDGEGHLADPGHLFVDVVLFNRLILDMSVGEWSKQGYIGHDFDVPLEWVKYNPQFDPEVRERITAADKTESRSVDTDSDPEQLALSGSFMDQFEDTITLRQLFLPRQKLVLTFAVGQEDKRPLRVTQWEGPEGGMYHPLCFGKVPGSLIPNAPVPQWAPLHDMINTLWNKASAQAARQKTLLLVSGGAAADGSRIVKAGDGDAIYTDNPKGAENWSTGGANPETVGMALQSKGIWEFMAGNIPALGGLAAQSDTAKQDQMLRTSASGRTDDMQQITIEAQRRVFEDMAYWLYTDPLSEYHLTKTVEGTGYHVTSVWRPEDRTADFTTYNFTIDQYSARPRSPQEEANEFVSYLQLLGNFMPMMEAQAMTLDMEWVIKRLAKLTHMPDLARAIRYLEGEAYPERGAVEKPRMPQSTERHYVRENRPAATRQRQDEVLAQHLFGLKKQPSEMASLVRTAS